MAYLSEQKGAEGPEDGSPAAPQPAGAPKPPQAPSPVPEPPRGSASELRTIQTLITVALIAGPVSMVIGGVVLSLIAVACAGVALAKARRATAEGSEESAGLLQAMRRQAMVGLGLGVVALAFNAVSLALIMPAVMEAAQTGDLSGLLGTGADGVTGAGSSGSSSGNGGETPGSGSVWG